MNLLLISPSAHGSDLLPPLQNYISLVNVVNVVWRFDRNFLIIRTTMLIS